MASVRDIFVRLGVKTDPRGFKRAAAGISNLKTNALLLVGAFAGVGIGFKKLIESASEIQETTNKFAAVFENAGDGVQAQLNDIAKRTGATNLQLQQMAGNIGAIIKPALGSAAAAGKMSAQVAELALDIASFNDVRAEDALVAIRSGLIGSAEPLQRFGVDVRVAALELEAMRQGISGSIKEMTEGQRVTLRFAAIQRQLGTQGATGDATRTAKDFANASRNLGDAIKQTAGIIGTFFLGATGNLVNRMRELVNAFQMWLAANRQLIQQGIDRFLDRASKVIGAVVAVIGRAAAFTRQWANGLGPVATMLLKIAAIAAGLAIILLLPGGALLLLGILVGLIIEDFEAWRTGGESVIGDLVDALDGLLNQFPMIRTALIAVKNFFIGVFKTLRDVVFSFIQFWIDVFTVGLEKAVENLGDNLLLSFESAFNAIGKVITGTIKFWRKLILGFVDDVIESLASVGGNISEAIIETGVVGPESFLDELGASIAGIVGADLEGTRKVGRAQRAVASPSGTAASVTDNSSRSINVEVNATPGMTAQDLAELVPREIQKAEDTMNRQGRRAFAESAP